MLQALSVVVVFFFFFFFFFFFLVNDFYIGDPLEANKTQEICIFQ